MQQAREMMTTREALRELGVSRSTLWRFRNRKLVTPLVTLHYGRERVYYDRAAILQLKTLIKPHNEQG